MVFVAIIQDIRNKNIIISGISIMTVTYQHQFVSNLCVYLKSILKLIYMFDRCQCSLSRDLYILNSKCYFASQLY